MKKINELVTSAEKPENRAKKKAITFGSFKRAEEKQIQERKDREHQAELARIAEQARLTREIADEEERVIREESKRKRNEFITGSLKNAFGTKTNVDMNPVREEVIDKYIPQLKEPKKEERPTPFKAEPALNAELEEFKKKINEHLHTIGFASSSGGGAGSFADLDDVDPTTAKVDGKTIQFDSSTNKFVGADVTAGALAADNLTAGDATILLTTSSGDITIDAAANNSDIIFKGTDGSADTTFLTIDGSEAGAATFNDKIIATELDISGNVDVDGTLEADAITVDGTTLAEFISDTAGGMFSSNTETGISATYQDADNTIDLELAAAQTSITSILAADLKIGEDDETKIDFETANEIHFYAANVEQVYLGDNVFGPESDSDVDLGTTGVRWKDAYIDTITTTGNVGVGGNITVTGDLTVNGDTTTVNTATLSVEDPLIILANGNNSADSVDIGFYGLYDTSGSQDLYAGLFRDANDSGKFKLFKDLQAAPTTTVNVSGTGYAVGTLVANIEGNVTGNTSGTAATVTTAAQSNITSLGTLTTLTVDNIIINGTNIGHTSDTDAIAIGSGGVVNFTQSPTVASAAIKTAGKETIYVPASAMYPTTTNGCASLAQVETTAQQPEFKVLDFDKDSDEHAQFTVAFPKSWNASTITFRAFWIGIAATTGCAWALQGRSVADNAESVGAFGTAVVVQDDSQGDATETLISAESGNVTIAGAADDTLTYFQIFRDVSDGNDDMAGDARLLGVQLFFTTDAANDA